VYEVVSVSFPHALLGSVYFTRLSSLPNHLSTLVLLAIGAVNQWHLESFY
jgi:hypothetical protein